MNIIDQYHGDPLYADLHVLTRDYPEARGLLKTASFDENKPKIAHLPSHAFAWESERRFPLHTREDTLASLFYRSKCAFHVPTQVDDKLIAAAQIYKIDSKLFSRGKVASTTPPDYALPEEQRLPLMGVAQVKMAEEVLIRDMDFLPLEKRASAFQNLFKAARRFQVQLEPLSLKMAGVTGSDTQFVREWLEARAAVAPEGTQRDGYDKLAHAVGQLPRHVYERQTLVKLAGTIAALDEHAGLNKHYGRKLPDPLLTVFNMEKEAEETCDVAGTPVPVSTLMSLPPAVWQQVDAPELGPVAASGDAEQFAQIFNTLPADLKYTIRDYVSNA